VTDDVDTRMVTAQLGRPPRQPWRVSVRCPSGYPQVVTSPPLLEGGLPFPTLHWLTCPFLVDAVGVAESSGESSRLADRIACDENLARRVLEADAAYRRARELEGGGTDVCAHTGVAGQADPLAVKCLHARVAAALAGLPDPMGAATLARTGVSCDDTRCASLGDSGNPGGPLGDDPGDGVAAGG
jgi:hypothetical protein